MIIIWYPRSKLLLGIKSINQGEKLCHWEINWELFKKFQMKVSQYKIPLKIDKVERNITVEIVAIGLLKIS